MKPELEKILMKVQKPGRYTGGEWNSVVKDKHAVDVRFAFCFPDTYEVGMSHLGMKILYSLFNEKDYIWCERVFAPWVDMEEQMRRNGMELFGLESEDSIHDFDILGFTLQYELSYSNVLNMLDLAHIPLRSADRKGLSPRSLHLQSGAAGRFCRSLFPWRGGGGRSGSDRPIPRL